MTVRTTPNTMRTMSSIGNIANPPTVWSKNSQPVSTFCPNNAVCWARGHLVSRAPLPPPTAPVLWGRRPGRPPPPPHTPTARCPLPGFLFSMGGNLKSEYLPKKPTPPKGLGCPPALSQYHLQRITTSASPHPSYLAVFFRWVSYSHSVVHRCFDRLPRLLQN